MIKLNKKIAEKNDFQFIDIDEYFLQLKDPLSVFHYKRLQNVRDGTYTLSKYDMYGPCAHVHHR